ncbi:MAG: ATP-grasp domain-containing protein, partial [bacterium]
MIKAGILGGGQLGRMLLQEAANYPVEVSVMEKDPSCPSAKLCHHFITGDITNYDDVIRFGEGLDVITIEIENVNVEALFELEKRGCCIIPKPQALRTIKNKILQKEFYTEHQSPTAPYKVLQNREELKNNIDFLPAVHKLATGGYDGKGVQIIKKQEDIPLGFDAPAVLEKMISIEKEIAIIVAVAENGKTAIYPPVEMFFDPVLNLLDLQLCPASIPEKTMWKAEAIALTVARKLDSPGIFAIEMFVDREGNVWV